MEEIEIGEYVRTKRTGICKIDQIDENKPINKYRSFLEYEEGALIYRIIKTTEIVNHSENIIDLIEVGDFVNGKEVADKGINCLFVIGEEYWIEEKEIKTILTKEQMEANQYVVK